MRRWLLLFLILVAFGRCVLGLGAKSLWWDESLSLHRARLGLPGILSNQITLTDSIHQVITVDNHPPLYFLLLRLTTRLLGESEFALRFLSLIFAVLTVPLLYITGQRLIPHRDVASLIAAALGAVSPMYLWYGQEARMYTMLAFLSLLSFYLYVRVFFDQHLSRAGWIIAYVGTSILLVATHYLGGLLVIAELAGLAVILVRRRSSRRLTGAVIITLIAIGLASLIGAWLNMPALTQSVGVRFVPLFELLRDLLNSFSLGLSVDVADWYVALIDLLFLLLLVSGLVQVIRRQRRAGWLLAGYLFLPILFLYLLSYVRPAYMTSRHLILVTPAFYLLVGTGLVPAIPTIREPGRQLLGGITRRISRSASLLLLAAGCVILAGIGYSTYNYFLDPRYDKDHHREWGAYLREHVRPGDVVIVDPPHIAELFDYYASIDVPWVGLPLLNSRKADTLAKLQELVGSYDRVWLARSYTPPWGDRGGFPEKWLTENAFRVDYREFESYNSTVKTALYLQSRPTYGNLPEGSQPLQARYGSALQLNGYRVVSPAQPGRSLHVELFWEAEESIATEASVVLRLVDSEGHVWGQGEQCPFNGLHPMWQWEPGTRLRDEHELSIWPGTPPGTYQLEMMLISRPSKDGCLGERGQPISPTAAVTGRGDRVLLGEVVVDRPDAPASESELGIEQRRQARYGDLKLLGEDVAPSEVKPGDLVDVTLYWQAQRTPLPDAQFRLQLLDAAGTPRVEESVRPAGPQYPTDQWKTGDLFKGQFRLWLPDSMPAGRYTVRLVPEPPLQQSGLAVALRRRLACALGDCTAVARAGVDLGWVEVKAPASGQGGNLAIPTPPTGLALTHPLLATLGNQVRLLGYDISSDTVQAGDTLSVTLYWQALRPMEIGYHVFTHVALPSGQVVAQQDGVPRQGAYPTDLWQTGEVVVDTYQVTVDPAVAFGEYELEVGMYRLENQKRLQVTDAAGQPVSGGRVFLAKITVLPAPTPTPVPPGRKLYLPLISK
jgi:4-amino-4-deoxy-L-arabinose transferase-like glycosyltransferase